MKTEFNYRFVHSDHLRNILIDFIELVGGERDLSAEISRHLLHLILNERLYEGWTTRAMDVLVTDRKATYLLESAFLIPEGRVIHVDGLRHFVDEWRTNGLIDRIQHIVDK